jgi:hypothetical protein
MGEEFGYREEQSNLDVIDTYADIVYCIDLTSSMTPIINKVKETARRLHSDLQQMMLNNYERNVKRLRIKVIGFRDAYCDGQKSFEVSRFFNLPAETEHFYAFVNGLCAKGGGDIPENALEALALAMRSDWCQTLDPNIRRRHIIVLFTDAPAHKLEKSREGIDQNYPANIPKDYKELINWWGQQKSADGKIELTFNNLTKRMGIFAPEEAYPWNTMPGIDFDNCVLHHIDSDQGGKDLPTQRILKMLSETLT